MGFNAASVPKLDWDFNPYVPARGVTPEPSQKVMDQFTQGLAALAGEVGGVERLGDEQAMAAQFSDLSTEEAETKVAELNSEFLATISDLTQGCPSREQLEQFQQAAPRLFNSYLGWLVGTLRPEAGSSATTA